jgi:hypothetical protein
LEAGAFVSAGAGVDLGGAGGGGGVASESAVFSDSVEAGAAAGLVESLVSAGGVVSADSAGLVESVESAGFESVGSVVSAGFDSGAGVGVAFVFELLLVEVPFPEVDFLFADVAGFRAESELDLLVAACPLASITNGSTTKPRIIRMYEALNIGGRN